MSKPITNGKCKELLAETIYNLHINLLYLKLN